MMTKFSKSIVYISFSVCSAICVLLPACSEKPTQVRETEVQFVNLKDTLQRINNALLVTDKERMDAYAKRMNYNFDETPTGLRYQFLSSGTGKKSKNNDIATFTYKIELLDGTIAYSSDNKHPKSVKIGQSGEQVGLDEALLLMREGDVAHFLLPPYLANGLLGDTERIPARAILYYKIELLKIN